MHHPLLSVHLIGAPMVDCCDCQRLAARNKRARKRTRAHWRLAGHRMAPHKRALTIARARYGRST